MTLKEAVVETRAENRVVLLGITGGIGSGKSFTAAEFVARGARRFDADLEARALYKDPTVLAGIMANWPTAVKHDGSIDRARLSSIVFAPTDAGRNALQRLNDLMREPLVARFRRWLDELSTLKPQPEFAVVDAPLLFEVGWNRLVDYVVFVDASRETRLRRVRARGWSSEELDRRESRQAPTTEKKAASDFIVDANQDDSNMPRQVSEILNRIRAVRDAERRTN